MNTGSKWALGCAGFLAVIVAAAMLGFWQMAHKYGVTSDRATVLERSQLILPLELPAPLIPGFAMYTAPEQQDPLVIYGVDDLQSSTVVTLASFEGPAVLVEFANRMHNIRRDLVPWREVVDSGVPALLTLAGEPFPAVTGNYVGEDGIERTAVLGVLLWEGRSVLVAAEGRVGEVDVDYVQALLAPLAPDPAAAGDGG